MMFSIEIIATCILLSYSYPGVAQITNTHTQTLNGHTHTHTDTQTHKATRLKKLKSKT